MTSREMFEYALIELNKLEAPSLLLEDYNYFINKAIQQYINLVYAKLEIDQQSTDDIRVLKTSDIFIPKKISEISSYSDLSNGMFKSSYYIDLPADYMHLLNCVVEFKVTSDFKCYNAGDSLYFAAKRLTPDMYSQILNNAYMRPMYKRPYYYLNNINIPSNTHSLPTNKPMDDEVLLANGLETATVEQKVGYYTALSTYERALAAYEVDKSDDNKTNLKNAEEALEAAKAAIKGTVPPVRVTSSIVDAYNKQGDRLANPNTVRLELRYGNDDGIFIPKRVYIDYMKAPMYIRLTQEQINSSLDYSQVLEFPDYVCFEIVNIFVRLVMENASDPRLQTNMPINNTIAAPAALQAAQQQTQK